MSAATLTIRKARPDEDWRALRALVAQAFAYMEGRVDPPSSIRRWDEAGFAAAAAEGAAFLAFDGERLTGCVFTRVQDDSLYLEKFAIAARWRGAGLARRLVAAAEDEARRLGLPALTLKTRVELTENHAAFAALGFSVTGKSAHPGCSAPTSLLMRKELAP